MRNIIIFIALTFTLPASADFTQKHIGTAYDKKNKIVYVEAHEATYSDDKKVKNAKTIYTNSNGTKIGELTSDFTKNLSAPEYKYTDFRHKTGHGIAYEDGKLKMIQYNKDGTIKTKFLTKKFKKNSIIVGGQGMHYYLQQNLESLKGKKNIPVIFLTPGNLDYYNFLLDYIGINSKGYIQLKIKISNYILRIFTSNLILQYDPKTKRLIDYDGLSNLTSDKEKIQSVNIKYKY